MEHAENVVENSVTDETATATAQDTTSDTPPGALTQGDDETDAQTTDLDQQTQGKEGSEKPYLPFSNGGREKFKVNGKEVEWDWATTQRYAQKGYAGMQALQEAAKVKQSAKTFYSNLVQAAQKDPETLVRTLLGDPNWQWKPRAQAQAAAGTEYQSDEQGLDPREAKIQELEQRLAKFEERDTQAAIEKERAAVNQEIDDAFKKYPVLKDAEKGYRALIKEEYRKALNNGMDVTIDDVAFYLAQDAQESRQKQVQQKQQRIEQKRKAAPVTQTPGAVETPKKGGMPREEVMRLAGRIP